MSRRLNQKARQVVCRVCGNGRHTLVKVETTQGVEYQHRDRRVCRVFMSSRPNTGRFKIPLQRA